MTRDRIEHLLVERIVPLLLIVLIPMIGMFVVFDRKVHNERRDQLRAACERGNVVREHQAFVFQHLIRTSDVLASASNDPELRRYFALSTGDLRKRYAAIELVDCQAEIR